MEETAPYGTSPGVPEVLNREHGNRFLMNQTNNPVRCEKAGRYKSGAIF